MVETAVTDIVRSAVATDNPLAALYEIVVEGLELLADVATGVRTGLNHRLQNCCQALCLVSIVLLLYPLLGSSLELGWRALVLNGLGEEHGNTLLHLLVAENHTETELAEVLEQRVVEGRTLTLGIGGVRC